MLRYCENFYYVFIQFLLLFLLSLWKGAYLVSASINMRGYSTQKAQGFNTVNK